MRGFDNWLTGGNYRKQTVAVKCVEPSREGACDDGEDCKHEVACEDPTPGCGWAGDGTLHTEYGTGWTTPEDCPDCGGEVAVAD